MRKALTILGILLVACLQAAKADAKPGAAPADEYFGPYSQSVIEIRNRLNDYDKLNGGAMLDPSVGGYLDHLQLAIRDWQHKYPADPWLPRILGHLMREYWRAGEVSSEHGMAALAFMRAAYPDASETTATVALIYGSNVSLGNIARDPVEQPAPVAPTPVNYAAASPYETPESYQTLPSYATADDAPANTVASSDATAPNDDAPPPDAPPQDDAPPPAR